MLHRAASVFLSIVALLVPSAVAGDGSIKVKDKSKPVRHELEQAYAALERALERNDVEGILALRTPDFSEIDCQGRRFSGDAARTATYNLVRQTEPPIDAVFTLGTIDLNGDDEAVVSLQRSFSAMTRMAGQLRRVDTNTTQDALWVRTPEGWRLRFVHNRSLEWYVDGKRVEPGKAYDPEAPPYQPEDRAAP